METCERCDDTKELVGGKCLDIPKAVPQLKVIASSFDKRNSSIKISFNHKLKKADFKSFLSVNIKSEKEETPKYDLESVTLSADGKTLEFKLNIKSSLSSAKISIIGMNSNNMQSVLTPHQGGSAKTSADKSVENGDIVNYYFDGASIETDSVDYFVPENDSLEVAAKKYKKPISTTLSAASIIPLVVAPA